MNHPGFTSGRPGLCAGMVFRSAVAPCSQSSVTGTEKIYATYGPAKRD